MENIARKADLSCLLPQENFYDCHFKSLSKVLFAIAVCLPTTKYFIVVSQVFIQQKILEEFEMRIKIKNKAFDCEKLARKLARNEA